MNLTATAKDVKMTFVRRSGGMADAHGSGPCGSNTVWVQVPSSALHKFKNRNESFRFFILYIKRMLIVYIKCFYREYKLLRIYEILSN